MQFIILFGLAVAWGVLLVPDLLRSQPVTAAVATASTATKGMSLFMTSPFRVRSWGVRRSLAGPRLLCFNEPRMHDACQAALPRETRHRPLAGSTSSRFGEIRSRGERVKILRRVRQRKGRGIQVVVRAVPALSAAGQMAEVARVNLLRTVIARRRLCSTNSAVLRRRNLGAQRKLPVDKRGVGAAFQ